MGTRSRTDAEAELTEREQDANTMLGAVVSVAAEVSMGA